jgi:hypothetical protein
MFIAGSPIRSWLNWRRESGPGTSLGMRGKSRADQAFAELRQPYSGINVAMLWATAMERGYLRSDMLERRRQLISDWAAYCSGTPVQRSATVVPLRGQETLMST